MVKATKSKIIYVCQACGKESPKWLGRCSDCQGWNTFIETNKTQAPSQKVPVRGSPARHIAGIELKDDRNRFYYVSFFVFSWILYFAWCMYGIVTTL